MEREKEEEGGRKRGEGAREGGGEMVKHGPLREV